MIKAFHTYCRTKGFVPLSDRKFVEEFKKTVFVRESRLTLYSTVHPDGERYRVWKGIELVGKVEKIVYSINKKDFVPDVHGVRGPQTQLEKNGKYTKIVDHGHGGQNGHENGDDS